MFAGFWSVWQAVEAVSADPRPAAFANGLWAGAPNPFVGRTEIAYTLAQSSRARLVVFDVTGQSVKTLVDGQQAPGRHVVVWDGRSERGTRVSPGVYFYRLKTDSYTAIRKTIVLK